MSLQLIKVFSSAILSQVVQLNTSATVVEEKAVFWTNHVSESVAIKQTENDIYTECMKTKSCFGMPAGCIETKNCVSFSAVIVKDGVFSFEMQSSSKNIEENTFQFNNSIDCCRSSCVYRNSPFR